MTNRSNSRTPASASVPVLVSIWRCKVTASGATPHPSSLKEYGQLKSLQERLGQETAKVLAWAVDNWRSFSQAAAASAGLPCAPPQPHIGFLLAHYDVAGNMMFRAGLLPDPGSWPAPVQSSKELPAEDSSSLSPMAITSESSLGPNSTTDVKDLWISLTTDADNPYTKSLTRNEVEQFSKQRSQLGDALFDSAVRFVLSNWYSFTMYVRTVAGETNAPSDPSAPFLLKHMTLAGELLREREAEIRANEVRRAEEAAQMAECREGLRERAAMEREAKQHQIEDVYRATPEEIARDLAEMEAHV